MVDSDAIVSAARLFVNSNPIPGDVMILLSANQEIDVMGGKVLTVGERVRVLRKEAGLTQIQVANRIGCLQSVISSLENNVIKSPSASLIASLADLFSTTPGFILTGKGDQLATTRLSENERRLLHVFRLLEERDQHRLLASADILLIPPSPTSKSTVK